MRLLTPPRLLQAVFALALLSGASAHAQIGIAVAKDDDNSTIAYRYVSGDFYASAQAEDQARRELLAEGFEKVYILSGGANAGHNIETGFFVIVRAEYRNYKGNLRVSYGLGASAKSWSEAEERALTNLSTYDWSWSRKKHGYDIVKKGRY